MNNEPKYEAELTEAAAMLQKIHPMGRVMGIGLLCVAQAIQEVGEELDRERKRNIALRAKLKKLRIKAAKK